LGVTEAEWLTLGNRYYQALAEPSTRKLALLVGINKYPKKSELSGCLTDVELQRELLVHRFGFQPEDIICLTDEKATRESIENAFLEHLVAAARPEDVVVFHFSGYGSRVQLGQQLEDTLENALVPVNGEADTQENTIANYLLEETLELMLRSLSTERVIGVLDTSFYAPTQTSSTGLRSRARQILPQATLTTTELEFKQKLQDKLAIKDLLKIRRNLGVLTATSDPMQLAGEVHVSGVSAGLFTYALTQSLWEATPATTIQISLSDVVSSLRQLGISRQQPALLADHKNLPSQAQLADLLIPNSSIGGQGVVIAIEDEGKTFQLWLGGLPLQVLQYYGANCRLNVVSQLGTPVQLVLRSRTGLTAKAQLYRPNETSSIQVGQLVQESIRVLPRNINLMIALDAKLDRIERVDATSAFATVSRLSSVVVGEQAADYVFGKVPELDIKDLANSSTVVSPSPYGLFSLGGELIPNTDGTPGEAVKVAVQRLVPKLEAPLAAKLWRLTENQGSSRLEINAVLEIIDGVSPKILMQRETLLTKQGELKRSSLGSASHIPSVPIGSRIQYRVENMSDRLVHLMLLGLNSSRTAIALYPWYKSTAADSSQTKPMFKDVVITPGEIRTVPQTTTSFEWVVQGPASLSETQLIISTAPFTQTLAVLEASKQPSANQQRIQPLINPLEVAQAVLQDLHNASAVADANVTTTDSYMLDVNNWASLNFIYQVASDSHINVPELQPS
jgi:hypothetical protein